MRSRQGHRRAMLAAAAIIGAAVLVALAVALAVAQRDSRRTVEERFGDGSEAAAALVQTIVTQAYGSDAALAQRRLGARVPSTADLRAVATRTGNGNVVVLDAGGRRVAAYPATAGALPISGAPVRAALGGHPAISGALPAGRARVVIVAVPYATPQGRRVFLTASPLGAVQRVLGPYLSNLPGLAGHRAYIIGPRGETLADSDARAPRDRALAAALRDAPRAANVAYDGGHRQLARAPAARPGPARCPRRCAPRRAQPTSPRPAAPASSRARRSAARRGTSPTPCAPRSSTRRSTAGSGRCPGSSCSCCCRWARSSSC